MMIGMNHPALFLKFLRKTIRLLASQNERRIEVAAKKERKAMKLKTNLRARLVKCCALLSFTAFTAYGAPVLYTFTATTRATLNSPSHLEQFQLIAPDFLPLVSNGALISLLRDDPALISCVACTDPPIPTLHFLRNDSSDLVQFSDADRILRPYFFSPNALSHPGIHDTLPGINVAVGKLVVSEVPEPSTSGLVLTGVAIVAFRLRGPALAVLASLSCTAWQRNRGQRRRPAFER
jgi:hypothetical protein